MSETEFYEWRLFYPLIDPNENMRTDTQIVIQPFSLMSKLNMLAISDEKHSHQSLSTDIYIPLGTDDVVLKIFDIEKLSSCKIDIEIRNRHNESSLIQHWSRYELKSARFDLPDRLVNRLDPLLIEHIKTYVQRIVHESHFDECRFDFFCIQLQKIITIWQMDESDRQIEQTDIQLNIHNPLLKDASVEYFHVPNRWRTIAIQTNDHNQLFKTLTTLQIDDDKNLLDYFSFLISQTRFNSFRVHHREQVLSKLSSEKAYVNLLTMSYAAFIELLQGIHIDQINSLNTND
jgi:hypothetical protein